MAFSHRRKTQVKAWKIYSPAKLGIEIYPDAGAAQAEIGPPPDKVSVEEIDPIQLLAVGIDPISARCRPMIR
ncbi:MAG: hypothetical protein IPO15_17670 [Anaerolineae bacterium]|uniref:hypothetical protein n=1 Tax=Candidatus Amarolinea dominans TaxID=3140696 RepID=UPI0031375761|nr:hypothetical protein [Anaerolineae bacterium]